MQNIFDEIEVPEKRLNLVVNENLQKVNKLYRRKKKQRIVTGFAAVVALAVAGIGIYKANPVLAAQIPLIGHLFDKVQDKTMYAGNYSEVAVPLTKDNVADSGGLEITLSEIYCNTEALNVSILIKSENAFPKSAYESNEKDENGQNMGYVMLESKQMFDFMPDYVDDLPIQVYGIYLDEYSFAGTIRVNFNVNAISQQEIPKEFQWKLNVDGIFVDVATEDSTDNKIWYGDGGKWEFTTDVKMDTENTIVKKVENYAPTGQGIATATKTPYEIILQYETIGDIETSSDRLQSITLDADGKRLTNKVGMIPIKDHNVSKITEYYFPVQSQEDYIAIQDRIYKGDQETLEDYVKSISTYQIEINFDE